MSARSPSPSFSSSPVHSFIIVAGSGASDSFVVIESPSLQFRNGGSFSTPLSSRRNSDRILRLPSTQMTSAE